MLSPSIEFLQILQQPELNHISSHLWRDRDVVQRVFAPISQHLHDYPQDTDQIIGVINHLMARYHQYSDAYLLIVFDWVCTHAIQPSDQAALLQGLIPILKSRRRVALAHQMISLIFYEPSWANPLTYQTLNTMRVHLSHNHHVLCRLFFIHLLQPTHLWQRQQLLLALKQSQGQLGLLLLLHSISKSTVWLDSHQRFSTHTRRQLSFFAHKKAAR